MPVRSGDFRILQGEPNGWRHTSPNGTPVISRFCGTRLYGERDGRPETISLRADTLDDTSWLAPSRIFLSAAHSRGCNRRPMHAALKPSPTAVEACCRHGVPAGRIRPINCRHGPYRHPLRPRAMSLQFFIQENCSGTTEPSEAVGNYHWFGRQFWSSRLRIKRRAEFGAWMKSWLVDSHESTCF